MEDYLLYFNEGGSGTVQKKSNAPCGLNSINRGVEVLTVHMDCEDPLF